MHPKCSICTTNEADVEVTTYAGKVLHICLSKKTGCSATMFAQLSGDRIRSYTTVNRNVQIESTRTGQIGSKFHGEGEGKAGARTKDNRSGGKVEVPAPQRAASTKARIDTTPSHRERPVRLKPRLVKQQMPDASKFPRV